MCVCGKGIKSHLKFQNYIESSLQVRKRDKVFDWWVGGFFGKCEIEKDGIYFVVCVSVCVGGCCK